MRLFIANCTKQHHVLTYRIPGTEQQFKNDIKAGGQIIVFKNDITSEEADAIISQHAPYGLKDIKNIPPNTVYVGLVYSIDKQVPASIIEKALRTNDAHLVNAGENMRKHAAVALDETLKQGSDGYRGDLTVEFTEEEMKNSDNDRVLEQISIGEAGDKPAKQKRAYNRRT